jgi:hypothetical protein
MLACHLPELTLQVIVLILYLLNELFGLTDSLLVLANPLQQILVLIHQLLVLTS